MFATDRSEHRCLIQKYLTAKLLEFELSEARRQVFALSESEVRRSQAETMLSSLLEFDKPIVDLSQSDLLGLYHFLIPEKPNPYRRSAIQLLDPTHQAMDPSMISRAIERFFQWVQSPSFGEMHAIEQMTVAQMRLYEIYPFPKYSGITISIFSYYFLLADGYLLPLYEVREMPEFCEALRQAFLFSTESLVCFNARACERAYDYVLAQLGV